MLLGWLSGRFQNEIGERVSRMSHVLLLDVAGAPIIIAGVGIITVAVFFAIIFVIILVARRITKMDQNKGNRTDDYPEE